MAGHKMHLWKTNASVLLRSLWSRLCDFIVRLATKCREQLEWLHTFLRSVGLSIVSAFVVRTEDPKFLVNTSRRLALVRCTIHILPSAVSLALININIRGHFIGNALEGPDSKDGLKLGLIQVAAKIQVRRTRLLHLISFVLIAKRTMLRNFSSSLVLGPSSFTLSGLNSYLGVAYH